MGAAGGVCEKCGDQIFWGGRRGAEVKKLGRLIFGIVGRVPVHFRLARGFAQVVCGWIGGAGLIIGMKGIF